MLDVSQMLARNTLPTTYMLDERAEDVTGSVRGSVMFSECERNGPPKLRLHNREMLQEFRYFRYNKTSIDNLILKACLCIQYYLLYVSFIT